MPFQKGHPSYHTEESRRKIGKANRGKHYSPKTEFQKGHIVSLEMRKKVSLAQRGRKHSKEHREKVSGKKCHLWKGGITSEHEKLRRNFEYRTWHRVCFERDNLTCQKCNQHGGELRVHHINNFSEFPELRFAIDNGITFCRRCHELFHKMYGNKNNTKEQLEEFLTLQ